MKQKTDIIWYTAVPKISKHKTTAVGDIFGWFFTLDFCALSALVMLWDVFPDVCMELRDFLIFEAVLLVVVFVYRGAALWLQRRKLRLSRGALLLCRIAGSITAAAVAGGMAVLYYRRYTIPMEDGMLVIANDYLAQWNKANHMHLILPPGKLSEVSAALLILSLAIVICCWCLAHLFHVKELLLLLPLTILSAELLAGVSPGITGLLFLLLGLSLMQRREFERKMAERQPWYVPILIVLLLTAVSLFTAFATEKPAELLLTQSKKVKAFQNQLEKELSSAVSVNLSGQSALVNNRRPSYHGKKIFTVTVDVRPSKNLYFKDLHYRVYREGVWKTGGEAFDKFCGKNSLRQKSVSEEIINMPGKWIGPDDIKYNYTINYLETISDKLYLPYYCELPEDGSAKLFQDTVVRKSIFQKSVRVRGIGDITSISENIYHYPPEEARKIREPVGYNDYVMDNYIEKNQGAPVIGKTAWRAVREAWDGFAAGGYEDSEELEAGFEELKRGLYSSSYVQRNYTRHFFAKSVSDWLMNHCTYSRSLDELPEETDAVEYFLSIGKKGYCVHFATAGVLMLREMGVPARYVSGYIIKAGDFQKNQAGSYTAAAADRNGHAWVEVYLDNIGWIPYEMTPGYQYTQGGLPTEEVASTGRQETERITETTQWASESHKQESSTTKAQSHQNERTGDKQAGNNKGFSRRVALFLLACAVICFLAVFLIYRRYKYLKHLKKELLERQSRAALRRLNRCLYRRLRRRGKLIRQGATDELYGRSLKKAYPELSDETWDCYMQIARKAKFSMEPIEEKEAELCCQVLSHCMGK